MEEPSGRVWTDMPNEKGDTVLLNHFHIFTHCLCLIHFYQAKEEAAAAAAAADIPPVS